MPTRKRHGFTLIELLVVIAIIALLLSVLLPSLSKARAQTKDLLCQVQLREIGRCFHLFADEHKDILPASYAGSYVGRELWQKSWIGSEAWVGYRYRGAIVPYLGSEENARKFYRCPSLAKGVFRSGAGSNGMFDYAMLLAFVGLKRSLAPMKSRVWDAAENEWRYDVPTPIVVEEDPANHINRCCVDPGHANTDRIGQWHLNSTGHYLALDGNVYKIDFQGLAPTTHQWRAKAPSGIELTLNSASAGRYGGWNRR